MGNDRFDMRKERFITIGYCDIAADFGLPEDEEGAIQTFEKISKAVRDLFKRYFDFKVLNNQTGERTRVMQSGNLSTMLKWMVAGTVALLSLAVVFGIAARYSVEIKAILSGLGV